MRQCRCSGPAVPQSGRAAVPQGEFDKSLSVCFDRPIHPPPPLGQPEILHIANWTRMGREKAKRKKQLLQHV